MRFVAEFACAVPKLLLLLLLLSAAAEASDAGGDKLTGWHDFRLRLRTANQEEAVRTFVQHNDLIVATENHLSRPEDVLVSPQLVRSFKQLLKRLAVSFDILETDVGSLLMQERLENRKQQLSFSSDPSTYFAPSQQIHEWLRSVASANSDIASVENIGRSYEGRELLVLKLSTDPSANKPVVFVDSAIHAREWLAPATNNYFIKAFLADRNSADVQQLLRKFDWYFLPVANPDGYDYTFLSDRTRFWRKTRKPYGQYYGADPNRNFDYQFAGPGTSNNPRSDIYHGPRPFSEPETLAMSQFLHSIRSRLAGGVYISLHTYGKFWLTTPGYTRVNPPDHEDQIALATIGNDAIQATNGISFKIGQPANVGLYEAAGGSDDWVKYVLGVKYSYTLELRPSFPAGLRGFVAKLSDIPLSGSEIYAALKAVAKALP